MTHASRSISKHRITLSNTTVRRIPVFGWRTTTSRVRWVEWMMTFSSSSSSPIFLTETAKAWLDHLPRNSIDGWEDLREIFTDNF
jgi:hypothetical protein